MPGISGNSPSELMSMAACFLLDFEVARCKNNILMMLKKV